MCLAQQEVEPVTEPKAATLPDPAAPAPDNTFFQNLFTPRALGVIPVAVLDQIHNFPKEWRRSDSAFGKRLASEAGQFVLAASIESAVKTLHKESTRYVRLGQGNFFKRMGYIMENTATARAPDGSPTAAYSIFASSYGSWAIATLWNPPSERTASSILGWGTANLGTYAARNLVREFWPDVKGLFHK
jgi:hypothetical protein